GRSVAVVHPAIQPGRRVLVLSADRRTPVEVASLLASRGYGDSEMTILSQLGGPGERVVTAKAASWARRSALSWPARDTGDGPDPAVLDDLNVVAIHCRAGAGAASRPRGPGLPDGAFEHDGQLTKREVRAVTLSSLAPVAGQVLWDV